MTEERTVKRVFEAKDGRNRRGRPKKKWFGRPEIRCKEVRKYLKGIKDLTMGRYI